MKMYVLQVINKYERIAYKGLMQLGFDAVLPIKEVLKNYGNKELLKEELIYPEYIFVQCDLDNTKIHEIRSIRGVKKFLGTEYPSSLSSLEQENILQLKTYCLKPV